MLLDRGRRKRDITLRLLAFVAPFSIILPVRLELLIIAIVLVYLWV